MNDAKKETSILSKKRQGRVASGIIMESTGQLGDKHLPMLNRWTSVAIHLLACILLGIHTRCFKHASSLS